MVNKPHIYNFITTIKIRASINIFLKYFFYNLCLIYYYNFSFFIFKLVLHKSLYIKAYAASVLLRYLSLLTISSIKKTIKEKLGTTYFQCLFNNKLFFFLIHYFFNTNRLKYILKSLRSKQRMLFSRLKKKLDIKITGASVLHISFSKRNMFLNLSSLKAETLLVTTLRKEGFIGRRRKEYTSVFSAVRVLKQKLKRLKIKRLVLVYKGWNRFRIGVKNSLRYWDRYKIPILYIRYVVAIPHNGCRATKQKRKKKKKKILIKTTLLKKLKKEGKKKQKRIKAKSIIHATE